MSEFSMWFMCFGGYRFHSSIQHVPSTYQAIFDSVIPCEFKTDLRFIEFPEYFESESMRERSAVRRKHARSRKGEFVHCKDLPQMTGVFDEYRQRHRQTC